jgi:hypothetical protein
LVKGDLSLPSAERGERRDTPSCWSRARLSLAAGLSLLATTVLVALPVVGARPGSVAAAASDPVLVAAGDIACGTGYIEYNGGNGKNGQCQMKATANEIAGISPQYLLPLGDTQYDENASQGNQPALSDYQASYDGTWGQLASTNGGPVPNQNIHPIAGGQEYGDVNDSGNPPLSNASNYFANFGPAGLNELPPGVNSPGNNWYSFNIPVNGGTWHVVSLDSECNAVGGCGPGSAEETFFKNDLAANAGVCTIVQWHSPRWSVGPFGNANTYSAFWNDAVAAHVVMVLGGHDHDYEHFGPMDANGNPSGGGTSEFIVGTGGESLDSLSGSSSALVASDTGHFGVLKMTLHSASADYAFRTVGGGTPDSGTVNCSVPPTVTSVSPSGGPIAGGTTVTVTGTHLTGATAVDFGPDPGTDVAVNGAGTSLTVTAPPGSAGTVGVTVVTASGTSATSGADLFSFESPPTVNGVGPTAGPSSGGTSVTVTGTNFIGASSVAFGAIPGTNVVVTSATSLTVTAPAGTVGTVDVIVTTPSGVSATGLPDKFTYQAPAQRAGYWMVGSDGSVFSFGGAPFEGSLPALGVHVSTVVAVVPTADSKGYWMIGSDGGVFAFGDAGFVGSLPGVHVLVNNIVGAVPTHDGKGYWMIGSDGGVFAFGDAGFVGSLPGLNVHINNIVAVVPTADNKGYWMIGSDGGVFAFGDAGFVGSLPGVHVRVASIVGAVPTSSGNGYWMVGNDGGVFAFGDAGFLGSVPGLHIRIGNVVGVVATQDNRGYWMVGNDGGVFAFGDAGFVGSVPSLGLHVSNVVAFARQ